MDWDGLKGTVGTLIDTALPLFLDLLEDDSKGDSPSAVDIGVVSLYQDTDGSLKMGNFSSYGPGSTALINFVPPLGTTDKQGNLAIELGYGDEFAAASWLQAYCDGNVAIGVTKSDSGASAPAGVGEALYTFATNLVLTTGNTIQAVVNPTLSVNFNLNVDASANVVIITAIGAVAVLGTTYMITAKNNVGKTGTVSGTLQPVSDSTSSASGDPEFSMALPSGIDYSEGIYDFDVQLAIQLSGSSVATNPGVQFGSVSSDNRERITRARQNAS